MTEIKIDTTEARRRMIERQSAQSGAHPSRRSDAESESTLGLGAGSVDRITADIVAERRRLLAEARAIIDGFATRRTDAPAAPEPTADPVAEARERMHARQRDAWRGDASADGVRLAGASEGGTL
ncbi:hypothetical protein KJ059_00535 [Myxococcota bacterium]|nr:hypothetical protein [Myxococcota bacterium]